MARTKKNALPVANGAPRVISDPQELVDMFGGRRPLAERLGVSRDAVRNWWKWYEGQIGGLYYGPLVRLCKEDGHHVRLDVDMFIWLNEESAGMLKKKAPPKRGRQVSSRKQKGSVNER